MIEHEQTTTKRQQWIFLCTASKLADAATTKVKHHRERFEWWKAKKGEVMAKVRESGIEVHEEVAALYSNSLQRHGPQIVIDRTLQQDLSECQSKITQHLSFASEYEGWRQVFSDNPESRLELTHQDWLHFFGNQAAIEMTPVEAT